MADINIQEIINSLPKVNNQRSYWFIRTNGGDFYKTFLENDYVAIGYDRIRLLSLNQAHHNKNLHNFLIEIIRNEYPDETRPGYIATQLIDFTYKVKKGDIVIIPSESSSSISIGEVLETPIFEVKNKISDNDCPYLKRKKVRWLRKNSILENIHPKLINIKFNQRTVTKIPEYYDPFIERFLNPIYIKNDNAHLAINIQRKQDLPAYDVLKAWIDLLDITEEFGESENLEINKKDVTFKFNVESPGTIEFITYSVVGITVLATLVVALIGAEVETNSRLFGNFKIKSDGLIKKVNDFLDKKKDRKIKEELSSKLSEMEINPEELANILKHVNGNSNKED